MKVLFRKGFFSDLSKINSLKHIHDIEFVADIANSCQAVEQIPGFKYLRQYPGKARIEVAPYRIGVEVTNNTIIFIRAILRNEFYNQFP